LSTGLQSPFFCDKTFRIGAFKSFGIVDLPAPFLFGVSAHDFGKPGFEAYYS
jgi:hypothetical protein